MMKLEDLKMPDSQYPCLCALIRRAGRIATRNYDSFLKPCGLKVTQLSMLAKIAYNASVNVNELAELLVMDQTTVSRNLRVLEKLGYICLESEKSDHRIKRIRISDLGLSKMNEAIPFWDKAQLEMEKTLGGDNIMMLIRNFKKIAELKVFSIRGPVFHHSLHARGKPCH